METQHLVTTLQNTGTDLVSRAEWVGAVVLAVVVIVLFIRQRAQMHHW